MSINTERLHHVYWDFNARHMEEVLAALDENVTWANGLGDVHGRKGSATTGLANGLWFPLKWNR